MEQEHNKNYNHFMARCLDLAIKGLGNTGSNPLVGSVIVCGDIIIGEGYHRKFGENHAEVNAIQSVKNKNILKQSTLFVNLEPCSHYGKTPACSDLIIRAGIPRVVIGTVDTSSKVAGKGIDKMKSAGYNIEVGIMNEESRFINRRFFTFHEKKRPYIILKWAQSADGFVDIQRGQNSKIGPNWISGPYERILVHKWRSEEEAILVGTKTAQKDDPSLNVRDWPGNSPLRLVIDRDLKLNHKLKLFSGSIKTVVFTEKIRKHRDLVKFETLDFSQPIWPQIMDYLYREEMVSLLIEGGTKTINSLLLSGLWDEARVFKGAKYFHQGVPAPHLADKYTGLIKMWSTDLEIYQNF